MNIEIAAGDLQLDIYGFGGYATNKDHAATAFQLSGKLWEVVKANSLKNKGKNIWVYETADNVFAGVELESTTGSNLHGLEKKKIALENYASYRHVGPYKLIKQTGEAMKTQLAGQGFEVTLPYIEIYGHWTGDEATAETTLLMCLK